MNVFAVAMAGVLATMMLALVRAFMGPTVFDRVLAANMFGTKTVLLIAVSGFLSGRPQWLDLALLCRRHHTMEHQGKTLPRKTRAP